jgi:predicted dehydrogenase
MGCMSCGEWAILRLFARMPRNRAPAWTPGATSISHFPGGATGLSANSMVADDYSFTLRIVGSRGDVLVHNFIKPQDDDRLTIRTPAGTAVERLGTRPSYTYQLEAFAAHVTNGEALPLDTADAVENMGYVDAAYRAAGMSPR